MPAHVLPCTLHGLHGLRGPGFAEHLASNLCVPVYAAHDPLWVIEELDGNGGLLPLAHLHIVGAPEANPKVVGHRPDHHRVDPWPDTAQRAGTLRIGHLKLVRDACLWARPRNLASRRTKAVDIHGHQPNDDMTGLHRERLPDHFDVHGLRPAPTAWKRPTQDAEENYRKETETHPPAPSHAWPPERATANTTVSVTAAAPPIPIQSQGTPPPEVG